MPVEELAGSFDLQNVNALKKKIKENSGKGAGKSLSTTLKNTKTGKSARVKLSNSFDRKRKLINLDPNIADTIAEAMASRIASKLTEDEKAYQAAPKVNFFVDGTGGVGLVSEYIPGVMGDLDTVRNDKADGDKLKKNQHVLMTAGGEEDQLNPVPDSRAMVIGGRIKKEMYSEIARRALMGDHDHNPGNSLVVKGADGKEHIAGIDYGHAFNDLVKDIGLTHHQKANGGILDSFNRSRVNGGVSKLRRDYRGVIPDPDFAEALRNTSSSANMTKIGSAISDIIGELHVLHKRGVSEKELISSIQTLCARMGKTIDDKTAADIGFDGCVTQLGTTAFALVEKNAKEAKSIANLIDVQAEVDKALSTDAPLNIEKIQKLYEQDELYLKGKDFVGADGIVEWLRTDVDKVPKKCSLKEYVAHRAKKLKIAPDKASEIVAAVDSGKRQISTKDIGDIVEITSSFGREQPAQRSTISVPSDVEQPHRPLSTASSNAETHVDAIEQTLRQAKNFDDAVSKFQNIKNRSFDIVNNTTEDIVTGAKTTIYVDPRLSDAEKKNPENHVKYLIDKSGNLSIEVGKKVKCILPPQRRMNGGFDAIRVESGIVSYTAEKGEGVSNTKILVEKKEISHALISDNTRMKHMQQQHSLAQHVTHKVPLSNAQLSSKSQRQL